MNELLKKDIPNDCLHEMYQNIMRLADGLGFILESKNIFKFYIEQYFVSDDSRNPIRFCISVVSTAEDFNLDCIKHKKLGIFTDIYKDITVEELYELTKGHEVKLIKKR